MYSGDNRGDSGETGSRRGRACFALLSSAHLEGNGSLSISPITMIVVIMVASDVYDYRDYDDDYNHLSKAFYFQVFCSL